MTERIVYWLDDYTDEIVPCDCSLEGWATWLSKPDEDWNRPEAAKDGEAFPAMKGLITYHVARRADDGGWCFEPSLPSEYSSVAVSYGRGKGWCADDLVENAKDLADFDDFEEGSIIAAICDDYKQWDVIYHANPPRCEAQQRTLN